MEPVLGHCLNRGSKLSPDLRLVVPVAASSPEDEDADSLCVDAAMCSWGEGLDSGEARSGIDEAPERSYGLKTGVCLWVIQMFLGANLGIV